MAIFISDIKSPLDFSRTTTIDADTTVTSTGVSMEDFATFAVSIENDQDSATNGIIVEWSLDNSTWGLSEMDTYFANQKYNKYFAKRGKYVRLRYINGGTQCTSVNIQTFKHARTSTLSNTIDTITGDLRVDIREPQSAFGEVMTVEPRPVVQNSFIYNKGDISEDTEAGTIIHATTEGSSGVAQAVNIYLPSGDKFTSGDYFTLQAGNNGTTHNVWFNVDSGGGGPGGTEIEVGISSGDTASQVAAAAQTAINADADFTVTNPLGNLISITNVATGACDTPKLVQMPSASMSTVTQDSATSLLSLTTGAGIGTYASVRSNRSARYRPGQGIVSRFTTIFNTGTSGTSQLAGMGNQTSGFFVGYNGTSFGLMRL